MEKWSHLVPSRTQKLSTSSASIATHMNSESSTLPVKDLYDVEVFLFLIMSYTVKAMITKNERETIELGKKLALALPKGSTGSAAMKRASGFGTRETPASLTRPFPRPTNLSWIFTADFIGKAFGCSRLTICRRFSGSKAFSMKTPRPIPPFAG